MYSVNQHQAQYLTYTLADEGAQSFVTVIPERGGIVTEWRWGNHDIFYLDRDRLRDPSLTVRGGIPILFPLCGGLPDNTYLWAGESYKLPQHGFARNLPWTVTHQDTQDAAALTVTLESNPVTLANYPFEFQLALTYQLRGGSLVTSSTITNKSSVPMPFSLGFHPYFAAPDKTQLEFSIPSSAYEDPNHLTYAFRGEFDLTAAEIDVIFRQLQHGTATVKDRSQNLQLTLETNGTGTAPSDRFFRHLVFWTVKEKDFYCLEPWSAARNALNSQENLTILEPGATLTTHWQITVSEI